MLLLSEEGVGVGVGYLITQPLLTHEFVHAISHTFSAKNEELALGQIERNNQDPTELPRKRKLVWGGKFIVIGRCKAGCFLGFLQVVRVLVVSPAFISFLLVLPLGTKEFEK